MANPIPAQPYFGFFHWRGGLLPTIPMELGRVYRPSTHGFPLELLLPWLLVPLVPLYLVPHHPGFCSSHVARSAQQAISSQGLTV